MTRRSTRSWSTPAPACSPGRRPGPGVSAETPPAPVPVPGDPADPARCHVEDGPAISVSTAQMVTCTAALSWMTHGDAGAVLALGRRRRRAQLRDPPRGPGTGRRPVPVPGLRVPPDRPAPHPALGQRRPHRPGQPDQPVPLAPQGRPRPRLPHRRAARRGRLRVLPPRRHAPAVQPAPARAGRPDRPGPRRGHHPGHDHPALVRRAPRPEPRHLGLLRQRQDQGRTNRAGRRTHQPGPRHHLRTRGLRRTLSPVPRTRPPAYRTHPDPNSGVTRPARRAGLRQGGEHRFDD